MKKSENHGSETKKFMKLYSKPNCPYCEKVKDFIKVNNLENKLELDNTYNASEVILLGGKRQFPFLLDGENKLYESGMIIEYLKIKYNLK
jgi:glutaredoxin